LGLFILLVSSCVDYKKNKYCDPVKTGKFSLKFSGQKNWFIIIRNDSMQYEKEMSTGNIASLKVKWMTSCEYELTLISRLKGDSIKPDGHNFVEQIKNLPVIKVSVTTVTKDYYIFTARKDSNDYPYSDTVWILK
jgi:hypothetical protein